MLTATRFFGGAGKADSEKTVAKDATSSILRRTEEITVLIGALFSVFYLVRYELASWKENGHIRPSQTKPEDIDDVLSLIYYPPYRALE